VWRKKLSGFTVTRAGLASAVDPKGADKVARVHAVQHLFAEGMIYLPAFSDGSLRSGGRRWWMNARRSKRCN